MPLNSVASFPERPFGVDIVSKKMIGLEFFNMKFAFRCLRRERVRVFW
jgi:hypothetical protein